MSVFKYFLCLFISANCIAVFAQNKQDSIYEPDEMIEDFNYLHQQIQLNHPGIFKYTSAQKWDSIYNETIKKLDKPLRDVKYRLIIRSYLSNVKCGHTQVLPSNESIKNFNKHKHYAAPFKVAIINNKLIVTENLSNDSNLVIGTEIIKINNHTAKEIVNSIFEIQNADAGLASMKSYYGASQFQSYFNAYFEEDSVFNLDGVDVNGNYQTFVVKEKKGKKNKIKTTTIKYNLFNQKNGSFRICGGDSQTAVMKISSFQMNNTAKFYSRAFDQLKENDIKYLILDLRGNGGGNILDAAELISYLSKDTFSYSFVRGKQGLTYNKNASQKLIYYFSRTMLNLFGNKNEIENQYHYFFSYDKKQLKEDNHFEGAVFCLIDNGSFSAASFVAAYMKHKAKAILIGQETAGTEMGCYAVQTPILILPNTKNYIRIPHYQFKHHLPITNNERGVIPNIEIEVNAKTIQSKNDEEMDLVWKLILENEK